MNGYSCVTVIDDLYFRQNAEEVEALSKERGEMKPKQLKVSVDLDDMVVLPVSVPLDKVILWYYQIYLSSIAILLKPILYHVTGLFLQRP